MHPVFGFKLIFERLRSKPNIDPKAKAHIRCVYHCLKALVSIAKGFQETPDRE